MKIKELGVEAAFMLDDHPGRIFTVTAFLVYKETKAICKDQSGLHDDQSGIMSGDIDVTEYQLTEEEEMNLL